MSKYWKTKENVQDILKEGLVLDAILTGLGLIIFFLSPISIVIDQGTGYGQYLVILLLPFTWVFVFGFLCLAGLVSSIAGLVETLMLFRIVEKSRVIKNLKTIDLKERRSRLRWMIRIGASVLILSSLVAIPLMLGFIAGIQ